MKTKRKSNFELLRIIAMLCIIVFHYAYKGGYDGELNPLTHNLMCSLGEFGVNLFMLITGFFMITQKRNWKKVILIVLQLVFYSILGYIVLFCCGQYNLLSLHGFILAGYKTFFGAPWYVVAYLLVYILSPYLNHMLNTMPKASVSEMIKIMLVVWCVIPTVVQFVGVDSESVFFYNRFIWFIIVYCIGGYIRNYPDSISKALKWDIRCFFYFCVFLMVGYVLLITKLKLGFTIDKGFWPPNTVLMLLATVSLFLMFRNAKEFSNKLINVCASGTLGIYLLHDGILGDFIREQTFFLIPKTGIVEVDILFSSIMVYIGCLLVDLIRGVIEKKLLAYF